MCINRSHRKRSKSLSVQQREWRLLITLINQQKNTDRNCQIECTASGWTYKLLRVRLCVMNTALTGQFCIITAGQSTVSMPDIRFRPNIIFDAVSQCQITIIRVTDPVIVIGIVFLTVTDVFHAGKLQPMSRFQIFHTALYHYRL